MKPNSHTLADPKDHVRICQLIRNDGFIYTNLDVQNMLRCSRAYLNSYIRPSVDHVITSKRVRDEMESYLKYIRDGKDLDGFILYSMNSLNTWFQDSTNVTRQTIRINMYPYIKNMDEFAAAYREKKKEGFKEFFFSSGRSRLLSEYLSDKGRWILSHAISNFTKRSETQAVFMENFLEKKKFEDIYRDLRRPREISLNDERARQSAFYEGMIRISLNNDLIYYYNPHDMLFPEFANYSIAVPYRFYLDHENEIKDITHQTF